MSLIADALKAAQQEKSKRVPAPVSSGTGGFFSVRGGSRSRDGLPKPLVYGLVAFGAIALVGALVTLLLSSAKPTVPPVTTTPLPPVAEVAPAGSPVVNPVPTQAPLVDSASAIAAATAAQTPAPAPNGTIPTGAATPATQQSQPPTIASTIMSGGGKLPTDPQPVAVVPKDSAPASVVVPPKPPGILRITMQDQPSNDARPLFQQALAAQRRGDVNRAKELYALALDKDPQNADLYNNIGMLYRGTGELDRAEDAYRHAISLNPKLSAAWSNLGVLLDARGRRKEAIAALQQAIALDPTNVGVKVNLALQYRASGLYTDARRLLEEAVRANPTMPEAQYALAQTLESLGERSSAIQHYDLFLSTSSGRFPQLERRVTQHLASMKAGT